AIAPKKTLNTYGRSAASLPQIEHNVHSAMVARLWRSICHPGLRQRRTPIKDLIESGRWITEIGRHRDARRSWDSLPGPAETVCQQCGNSFFSRESRLIGRGIKIAANNPGERAHSTIGLLHCFHV